VSQNRAVTALIKNNAQACGFALRDDDIPNIHISFLHFSQHETPEDIIAAFTNECDFETQPRRKQKLRTMSRL
jgi:hypothetical protein